MEITRLETNVFNVVRTLKIYYFRLDVRRTSLNTTSSIFKNFRLKGMKVSFYFGVHFRYRIGHDHIGAGSVFDSPGKVIGVLVVIVHQSQGDVDPVGQRFQRSSCRNQGSKSLAGIV